MFRRLKPRHARGFLFAFCAGTEPGGKCGLSQLVISAPLLFHSSSASRFTAGAFAFFILSQSGERPER
jgi:hypothetical protein